MQLHMNHIFMEPISAYQRVWSVPYPHSLFKYSNCNRPSHMCFPSTLISSFLHGLDILMKTLAMFISHVSKISRKFIEMTLEEMNFYAHVAACSWKLSSNVSTKFLQFAAFAFPKNLLTTATNAFHALFLLLSLTLKSFYI